MLARGYYIYLPCFIGDGPWPKFERLSLQLFSSTIVELSMPGFGENRPRFTIGLDYFVLAVSDWPNKLLCLLKILD